jgi:hypothetical protein
MDLHELNMVHEPVETLANRCRLRSSLISEALVA